MLTALVLSAADGELILGAVEMPALRATSSNVEDIVAAVKAQAAFLTGRSPADFLVDIPY